MELEFSGHIFENNQILNFLKLPPVGDELFHAGRQTDRHDESNFSNAPNNRP